MADLMFLYVLLQVQLEVTRTKFQGALMRYVTLRGNALALPPLGVAGVYRPP